MSVFHRELAHELTLQSQGKSVLSLGEFMVEYGEISDEIEEHLGQLMIEYDQASFDPA